MADNSPLAVKACHALLQWMIPLLDKFPRVRRFTLGGRIEDNLLTVLESLVEAAYSPAAVKQQALKRANLKLETLRHLWRVSYELNAIPLRRYEHGSRLMDELGRQIGGWLRSQRGRS